MDITNIIKYSGQIILYIFPFYSLFFTYKTNKKTREQDYKREKEHEEQRREYETSAMSREIENKKDIKHFDEELKRKLEEKNIHGVIFSIWYYLFTSKTALENAGNSQDINKLIKDNNILKISKDNIISIQAFTYANGNKNVSTLSSFLQRHSYSEADEKYEIFLINKNIISKEWLSNIKDREGKN